MATITALFSVVRACRGIARRLPRLFITGNGLRYLRPKKSCVRIAMNYSNHNINSKHIAQNAQGCLYLLGYNALITPVSICTPLLNDTLPKRLKSNNQIFFIKRNF